MKRGSNEITKQKTEIKRQEKHGKEGKGTKRKNEFEILKAMSMEITMVGLWRRVAWYKELCTSFPSK
jgi:hypothetical protein